MTLVMVVIVLAAIIGLVIMMSRGESNGSSATMESNLFTVSRGDFTISIPTNGELRARRQTEIVNKLESSATLTYIIEEGAFVKQGDVLFTLNDDDIRNRIQDAEDQVTNAEQALEAANSDLKIELNDRDSRIAEAELRIELAKLAYDSWREGDVVTRRKELALAKEKAEKNYIRLSDRFDSAKRLLEKDFISLDEYRSDEISMIEARARLEQTELDIKVYEEYTHDRERKQKESDLEQATQELERVQERTNARVASAEGEVDRRERNLENTAREADQASQAA